MGLDKKRKLRELEKKLTGYKKTLEEKKRVFRGIKHEDSLSELRYTQYMVYKSMVEGLETEIIHLKKVLNMGE